MKSIRYLLLFIVCACGSKITVCERDPDVEVGETEQTVAGAVDQQMEHLPDVLHMDAVPHVDTNPAFKIQIEVRRTDQPGRFSDGTYETYNRPKYSFATSQTMMYIYCDDILYIPVEVTMTDPHDLDSEVVFTTELVATPAGTTLSTDHLSLAFDPQSKSWSGVLLEQNGSSSRSWAILTTVEDG